MQAHQRSSGFLFFPLKYHDSRPVFGRKTRLLEMCENMTIINKKDLSWITSPIQVITSVDQTGQGEEKQLKQ